MRINKLEPNLFNKIAAGEVVERPASIVKELVENSIDAGATSISVSIENGGITQIKVTDNGKGIHYDDLLVAFLPHATSKIQKEEDLFSIKTLGFRGEALASIAAVSQVCLVSKFEGAEVGGKIEISGGEVVSAPSPQGAPSGTDITVSNLFFNVPARAKFLKKPKTEESEITNLISRIILANPYVSIKYIVDGKIKMLSSGKGMEDALFEVYGKPAVEQSVYFERDFGYIRIYGYIGKPSFSKPNRTYQTIIINNRVIQNTTISTAVQNAYGELLMKKQFPFFCLYIELDYEKVDVNVHPNKSEVRFEDGRDIYLKVFEAVSRKINNIDYTNNISLGTNEEDTQTSAPVNFSYKEPSADIVISAPIAPAIKPKQELILDDFNPPVVKQPSLPVEDKKNEIQVDSKQELMIDSTFLPAIDTKDEIVLKENQEVDYSNVNETISTLDEKNDQETRNIFSTLAYLHDNDQDSLKYGVNLGSKLLDELTARVSSNGTQQTIAGTEIEPKIIGVLFNTYIIIEHGQAMLIIDQHAGHERVLFDKFMGEVKAKQVSLQTLLMPYVLEVNVIENGIISNLLPNLNEIGFIMEEFGSLSYKVSAVPYMLADINLKEFFDSLLSDERTLKQLKMEDLIRDRIATMACKAAVKAGDVLDKSEIKMLINLFIQENNKLLCPHGRPVVIMLEKKELEKWFKRIV